MAEVKVAIGLTGPFGSGCSTAATMLQNVRGFKRVTLSDHLKDEWRSRNGEALYQRAQMQALGNELREEKGSGFLAQAAVEALTLESDASIVIDGIRNLGEVAFLKQTFGTSFFLFAVECPTEERLRRLVITGEYKQDEKTRFYSDDRQDQNQEYVAGQQVELTVDRADVLIVNDATTTTAKFEENLFSLVDLVSGDAPRYPFPQETYMNLAYSFSHGSKCLKRQVGAVLVAAGPGEVGAVKGVGFNENPIGTSPCVEEKEYGADPATHKPGRCYRDILRGNSFADLGKRGTLCPSCGQALPDENRPSPPWRCPSCSADLEVYFWPERALTRCTAVHAEVQALMAAGWQAEGTTLYTTTLPCFQCSEKIAQARVSTIIFNDPYPDIEAADRLDIAGITVARFEGVRSGRFDDIFAAARPYHAQIAKGV